MSVLDQIILAVGLVVSSLCLGFVYQTFVELRRIDEAAERRSANLPASRAGSS
jgi:hypothetical protein